MRVLELLTLSAILIFHLFYFNLENKTNYYLCKGEFLEPLLFRISLSPAEL